MSIDGRAVITTKIGKSYRPLTFGTLDSYFIDTAMDTDTDTWSITLGDPGHALKPALSRNAEVRADLYVVDENTLHGLHSGFADEVSVDEENMFTIDGRDISCVAVDSQVKPKKWADMPPHRLVQKQARILKIGHSLHLDKVKPLKSLVTDGTESYWDLWYRAYRHRKRWMWAEPDGSIWATMLNYNDAPSYKFGIGSGDGWIPVISLEWRANKQQRVYESFVFGHVGDKAGAKGFVAEANAPNIKDWIKKRTIISNVTQIHSRKAAREEALEELFESEVGAVEIKLVVAYSGRIIRQNRMALVNLPQVALKGKYFVVGSKIIGDQQQGLYQEVRLRERKFAISTRVPFDPKLEQGSEEPVGESAAGVTIAGARWSNFFIEAAKKHHGPWPFVVFLGVLLAICEQETGFANVRRGGHIEWPGKGRKEPPSVLQEAAFAKFANSFANERAKGRVSEDYAVGPMQLLSLGYKHWADDTGDNAYGVHQDELFGNRWNPRSNIIAGARALRDKLQQPANGAERNPTEDFIWNGVAAYGEGRTYANEVRQRYEETWKAAAQEVLSEAGQRQSALGYVNPFRDAQEIPGRIDMGVDYGGVGPILAIGDGVVIGNGGSGWPGGNYLLYRLTSGSLKGKYIFVAEHIVPKVSAGDHISMGQVIAHFASSARFGPSTGIEIGWGSSTLNRTLAAATTGYDEGDVTDAGKAFCRLLKHLGAKTVPVDDGPYYPRIGGYRGKQ